MKKEFKNMWMESNPLARANNRVMTVLISLLFSSLVGMIVSVLDEVVQLALK